MGNKSKQQGASSSKQQRPEQSQPRQPGRQQEMLPQPVVIPDNYRGSDKLAGKTALITGGDSGIGRSVAVMFAREGADVAIVYLEEVRDAEETQKLVVEEGRRCVLLKGDVGRAPFCRRAVEQTVKKFGRLDILVNNAAQQHVKSEIEEIDETQLVSTFRTNLFSMFFFTQAALPHLKKQPGSCIINTSSVTAYRGSPG